MPNWCENTITFYTPEDKSRFVEAAGSDACPLDFNKVLPTPDGLDEKEAKQWRAEHWGTSAPLESKYVEGDDTSLSFETAWTPAVGIYGAIVDMLPDLPFHVEYEEPNEEFEGEFIATGCGTWADNRWDYTVIPIAFECERSCWFSDDCPEECPYREKCEDGCIDISEITVHQRANQRVITGSATPR